MVKTLKKKKNSVIFKRERSNKSEKLQHLCRNGSFPPPPWHWKVPRPVAAGDLGRTGCRSSYIAVSGFSVFWFACLFLLLFFVLCVYHVELLKPLGPNSQARLKQKCPRGFLPEQRRRGLAGRAPGDSPAPRSPPGTAGAPSSLQSCRQSRRPRAAGTPCAASRAVSPHMSPQQRARGGSLVELTIPAARAGYLHLWGS